MYWTTGDNEFEFPDGSSVDFSSNQADDISEEPVSGDSNHSNATNVTTTPTTTTTATPEPVQDGIICVAYNKENNQFLKVACENMKLPGICRQIPGGKKQYFFLFFCKVRL